MVVYWDSVLLFNGVCDYLLLLCAVRLAGRAPIRKYLLFASLLGAFYALFTCLFPIAICAAPLILAAMGRIAFHKSGSVGKLTLLFALLSCLLAGLLVLLGTLRGSLVSMANGISFGALPWHIFAVGFAVSYLLLGVLFRGGLQKSGKDLVKVTFDHHDKSAVLQLLCDSGNLLKDANGVCIPIVEEDALSCLNVAPGEFCEMSCRTVGGDTVLRTFICDRITIGGKTKEHCQVALTPQKIGGIYAGLWCEACMEEDPCVAL